MANERVRELAREHPEAFAKIAGVSDGQLGKHLNQVLEEETDREPE